MTLQEFITKYNAKHWDFDNKPPFNQCMDIYRQYVKEVWQQPQTPTVVGAKDVFATIDPAHYDKFTSGQLLPGDVVVWNEKFASPNGHIAIVENPSDPKSLVVFGQNDPLGSVCKLSRHSYANIIGWFRPKPSVSKTYMSITVVANKITWDNLHDQLSQLKAMFVQYSGNRFEPVFSVVASHFDSIPLVPFISKDGQSCIDVNWYRNNVTPLGNGSQATLFLVNEADYQNGLTWGFMSYGDTGRPVRMEVAAGQNGADFFLDRAYHEICHALLFLTGQPDVSPIDPTDALVHYYMYQNPVNYKGIIDFVDEKKLQEALVHLH